MLLLTACETERPMPTEDSGRIYVYSLMSDSGRSVVNTPDLPLIRIR